MAEAEAKDDKKKKKEKLNLSQTLKALNKEHGPGIVMTGRSSIVRVDAQSTGIPIIDQTIGIGGWPKGRIIEVFGPESCGKTTIALLSAAAYQAAGEKVAFIDVEHALDPVWATKLGVNMEALIFSQPDSGEQALDIVEALVKTGEVGLVIVDSVAALASQKELDGEMDDTVMAGTARIMSKGCRKLKGCINTSKAVVLFINQIREKVGVMFGSPETTPGGRALKFYASVRIRATRAESITKSDKAIGHVLKFKVIKNKVAAPFKDGQFNIYYGNPVSGIDYVECLFEAARGTKTLTTKGSVYYLGADKVENGAGNVQTAMKADPALCAKIKTAVYESFKAVKTMDEMTDEEIVAEDGFEDEVDDEEENEGSDE